MKLFILSLIFSFLATVSQAQVNTLPSGRYETVIKNNGKWDKGDILLQDDGHYRIGNSNDSGEFRFSATAQRVFFTSGPLKGIYARTVMSNNTPAILIPLSENQQLGLKLATGDIVGSLKN